MSKYRYSIAIVAGLFSGVLVSIILADAVAGIFVAIMSAFVVSWFWALEFGDVDILKEASQRVVSQALLVTVGKHGHDALTNRHNHWPGSKIVAIVTASIFGQIIVLVSYALVIVTKGIVAITKFVMVCLFNLFAVPFRVISLAQKSWKIRNYFSYKIAQITWLGLAVGACYCLMISDSRPFQMGPVGFLLFAVCMAFTVCTLIVLMFTLVVVLLLGAFRLACGGSVTKCSVADFEVQIWKYHWGNITNRDGDYFWSFSPDHVTEERFHNRALNLFVLSFFQPVFNLFLIPVANTMIFCIWAPIFLASKKTGLSALTSAGLSAGHLTVCYYFDLVGYSNPRFGLSLLTFAFIGFWIGRKIHNFAYHYEPPEPRFFKFVS